MRGRLGGSEGVATARGRGRESAIANVHASASAVASASASANATQTQRRQRPDGQMGEITRTYLWEHAICASSQVTGLAGPLFGCAGQENADRVVQRATAVRRAFAGPNIGRILNRRNTWLRYLS
jgi:hypothetical protein